MRLNQVWQLAAALAPALLMANAQPLTSTWSTYGGSASRTGAAPANWGVPSGPLPAWSAPTGGCVSSAAIAADGTVVFGSIDASLYAVHPNNGSVKWRQQTDGYVNYYAPTIGVDGTVYVGTGGNGLYAYTKDGGYKWRFPTGGPLWTSPAISSDGTVIFSSWDGRLYAITSASDLVWKFNTGSFTYMPPSLSATGNIYIGSKITYQMYALSPNGPAQPGGENGAPLWTYTATYNVESPAIVGTDGSVYLTSSDSVLHAVTPGGSLRWKYTYSPNLNGHAAIGADGTVYHSAINNTLHAIHPNGSLRWSFWAPGAAANTVMVAPAVGSDGTIYVGSHDFHVYAITPSGKLRWKYRTDGRVYFAPTFAADGSMFVGSCDGNMYGFAPLPSPSVTPTATPSVTPSGTTSVTSSTTPTISTSTTPTGSSSASRSPSPAPTDSPTATPSAALNAGAAISKGSCAPGDTACSFMTVIISVASSVGGVLTFVATMAWRRYSRHTKRAAFAAAHPLAASVFNELRFDVNDHAASVVQEAVAAVATVEAELRVSLPRLEQMTEALGATHLAAVATCMCYALHCVDADTRVPIMVTTTWPCTCGAKRSVNLVAARLVKAAPRIASVTARELQVRDARLFDLMGGVAVEVNPMLM
jgi:outer membrane protein assembly factor BamB